MQRGQQGPYAVDQRVLATLELNKIAIRSIGRSGGSSSGNERQKRASSAQSRSSSSSLKPEPKVLKKRPVSATIIDLGMRAGDNDQLGRKETSAGVNLPNASATASRTPWHGEGDKFQVASSTKKASGKEILNKKENVLEGKQILSNSGSKKNKGVVAQKIRHTQIGTLRSIYAQSKFRVNPSHPSRPRSSQAAWDPSPCLPSALDSLPTKTPVAPSSSSTANTSTSNVPINKPHSSSWHITSESSLDAEILMEASKTRATIPELVTRFRNAPSIGDLDGEEDDWLAAASLKASAGGLGCGASLAPGSGTTRRPCSAGGARNRPASAGGLRGWPHNSSGTGVGSVMSREGARERDQGGVRSSAEMVREWKRSCSGQEGGGVTSSGGCGEEKSVLVGDVVSTSGKGEVEYSIFTSALRGSVDDGVIGLGGTRAQMPKGVVEKWRQERERCDTFSGAVGDVAVGGKQQPVVAADDVSRVRKRLLGGLGTVNQAGSDGRKSFSDKIRQLALSGSGAESKLPGVCTDAVGASCEVDAELRGRQESAEDTILPTTPEQQGPACMDLTDDLLLVKRQDEPQDAESLSNASCERCPSGEQMLIDQRKVKPQAQKNDHMPLSSSTDVTLEACTSSRSSPVGKNGTVSGRQSGESGKFIDRYLFEVVERGLFSVSYSSKGMFSCEVEGALF